MGDCEMTATRVFEWGERLEIVRSSNIIAAGMSRDRAGMMIHYAGRRSSDSMYLFPGATEEDARKIVTAQSAVAAAHELEGRIGVGERVDGSLTETLEETWGYCDSCRALVESEVCPVCGTDTPSDFAVVRCQSCRTYVVSVNGGRPIGGTCEKWAPAS
jgi:hypothetical protein